MTSDGVRDFCQTKRDYQYRAYKGEWGRGGGTGPLL